MLINSKNLTDLYNIHTFQNLGWLWSLKHAISNKITMRGSKCFSQPNFYIPWRFQGYVSKACRLDRKLLTGGRLKAGLDGYKPLNVAIFSFSAKIHAGSCFSGLTYKSKFVQIFGADISLLMHYPPRTNCLDDTSRKRRDFSKNFGFCPNPLKCFYPCKKQVWIKYCFKSQAPNY